MMERFFAFLCGGAFGLGILWAGLTDPVMVRGFLDVFGDWNPTLGFAMVSATAVAAIGWKFAERRKIAAFGHAMPAPPNRNIDRRLVAGALTFGVGWGIAGVCPGPVLVSSTFAGPGPLIFIYAMLSGLALASRVNRHQRSQVPRPAIVRIPVTVQS